MTLGAIKMLLAAKELERLLTLECCHPKGCMCEICEARGELRYRVRKYEVEHEEIQKSLKMGFSTADPNTVQIKPQEGKATNG